MQYLLLLLIGLAIAGCGSRHKSPGPPAATAPRTADDQVVRGVGNLRRLLVLPVVVQPAGCDWPEVARDLDEAAVRFLRDWKGYELVRPKDPIAAAALAGQVGAWQDKVAGSGNPPAEVRDRLGAAAEYAGTDGILVVHATPECPRGPDAGLLALPARLAGSLDRTLSAGVYEADTGTLVWQNQIRPTGWDPARYGAQPPPRFETRQAAEALFAPIENAIPGVLETSPRPRRPPPPAPTGVEVKPAREPAALTPSPLPGTGAGQAPTSPTTAPGPASPPAAPPAAAATPAPPPPATEAPTPAEAANFPQPSSTPAEPMPAPVPPPAPALPPPAEALLPALPAPEGPASRPPAEDSARPAESNAAPDAEPSAPKAPIRT